MPLSSFIRVVLVALASAVLIPIGVSPAAAAAPPAPVARELFGLHVNDLVSNDPTVPFGTVRLWDAGVTWRDLEPAPGQFNFAKLDLQVAKANAEGKDIVMVLGQTPQWASKRPAEDAYYGKGAAAEPKDIRSWRAYVRKLAIRYKGKIRTWEIYNEPNAELMFSGTPQVMAGLGREAWIQLKTIDPRNYVVSPGIVTRTLNSPKWLDAYLKAGGGRYANAIAVHFYVKARERPEDTIRYLGIIRKIVADNRVSHLPLWNTESGYGRYNPTDRATHEIYGGSLSMAYVARTYALMAAGGVARSYWYGWDQRNFTGLYLTTNGRDAGVAGRAYGVTYGWLVGSRVHSCAQVKTGAIAGGYSCVLTKGSVQRRMLWHPDRTATIRIPAGYRSLHQLDGSKTAVRSGRTFTVGPVPVLISTSP